VLALARPLSDTWGLSLPSGWGVQNAYATDQAADCVNATPTGASIVADSAAGAIGFYLPDGGWFPCTLDVHVSLNFSPAWVNPVETMDANGVVIDGGCLSDMDSQLQLASPDRAGVASVERSVRRSVLRAGQCEATVDTGRG